jgi:uncharacterized RDD family membrane protein YckC
LPFASAVAQGSQFDPYRPPEFDGPRPEPISGAGIALATRGERLGAAMLDGLLQGIIFLPIQIAYGVFKDFPFIHPQSPLQQLGWLVASMLVYLTLNGYLLARSGQTLGKRAVGIRIVNFGDGAQTPLGKIVVLRVLPISLVTLVPKVGVFASLIDDLVIFRSDRRCLHDHLAGTVVVKVSPSRPADR